jgi:hypothetical protein
MNIMKRATLQNEPTTFDSVLSSLKETDCIEANKNGIAVIKQVGDIMVVNDKKLQVF